MTRRRRRCQVSPASGAATYNFYIGPSGSDANPGTQVSPWALTALATKTASIGNKTIGILAGTYITTPNDSGGNNTGGIQCTANNVTLKYVTTPRSAIITTNNAGSYPQYTDPALQVLGTGWVFDGVAFFEHSFNPVRYTGNTTFNNCLFESVLLSRIPAHDQNDNVGGAFGATGAFPTAIYYNCKFKNIKNGNLFQNASCIGPMYDHGPLTITNCSFFDAPTAMYWKANNLGPVDCQNNYFDNTITGIALLGLLVARSTLVQGMSVTLKNCISAALKGFADGMETNFASTECIAAIEHNSIFTSTSSNGTGYAAIGYQNPATGALLSGANLARGRFKNNVIHRVSGTENLLFWQTGRNSSVDLLSTTNGGINDWNQYADISMNDVGTTYTTLANWKTRTGQELNSLQSSNTYVNTAGNTPASFAIVSGGGKNSASDGTDRGANTANCGCNF